MQSLCIELDLPDLLDTTLLLQAHPLLASLELCSVMDVRFRGGQIVRNTLSLRRVAAAATVHPHLRHLWVDSAFLAPGSTDEPVVRFVTD
jgi:hypothetical protein